MEFNDICQRCQNKQVEFICNNCKPFTAFCSQCDTAVHTLPIKMNHYRKQFPTPSKHLNNASMAMKQQQVIMPVKDVVYKSKAGNEVVSVEHDNDLCVIDKDKSLYIENKQLKREIYDLKHRIKVQNEIKDDVETYSDSKLIQLHNEGIALKKDNMKLCDELNEKNVIVDQLQKQVEQMNNALREKSKEIDIEKEKYRNIEGFFKFKYEEMQKEKDYLINQLRASPRNNENHSSNNYQHKENNTFQFPIKDNNASKSLSNTYEYHH